MIALYNCIACDIAVKPVNVDADTWIVSRVPSYPIVHYFVVSGIHKGPVRRLQTVHTYRESLSLH